MEGSGAAFPRPEHVALVAVALGALLRFTWPGDVEFKADEAWMWERARALSTGSGWTWSGMESSASLSNPGASVWAFAGLVRIFGLNSPPGLSMAVAACAVLALLTALWVAWRVVTPDEREPWLWGVALAAVSPLAVLLQRKIWAQSLLPLAAVLLFWCWLRRDRSAGAAGWGALGILMGQVHLSGFFLVAALAMWTRWRAGGPATRWRWWWTGTLVGGLPLVPWALEALPALVATARQASEVAAISGSGGPLSGHPWWNAAVPRFWGLWATEPAGPLLYSLGPHYPDFLRWPYIGSVPTYLMAAATGVAFVATGLCVWSGRRRLAAVLRPGGTGTEALLGAAVIPYGVLLTLTTLTMHRHYLIAVFPLPFVWVAWLSLAGEPRRSRRWLVALVVTQLTLSAGFLHYIHKNGGAPLGDYGLTWSAQEAGVAAQGDHPTGTIP